MARIDGLLAVSTTLLSEPAENNLGKLKKIFYADDGGGAGSLDDLHSWWQDLQQQGPPLGYFPNATKTWLIVKPEHQQRAEEMFADVNITSEGHKYLSSFIGNAQETVKFVEKQIDEWSNDIDALVEIAESEPQLDYCAYVFGTSRRSQFVCRTTPNITEPLTKLENLIREKLIPAFFSGRNVPDEFWRVYGLPD